MSICSEHLQARLPMMVSVFDRPRELSVFDQKSVLHVEGEIPGTDLNLAVREVVAIRCRLTDEMISSGACGPGGMSIPSATCA